METKLVRIAELAKSQPKMKFTSLAHLLDVEALKQCHYELPSRKAPGIHQTTKEEYELDLETNISDLVKRMKQKSYRPIPVRRTYISKPGTKIKRPLGIPEHEDKIVQRGIAKILNAIYEQDFMDSSFGFRPKRSCHDALKILNVYINTKYTNYVVDADIKGFFNNVDHTWMMSFLKHRIEDPNILRIIARFLKGGYMEEGKLFKTEDGTPQGGIISPILANIYLHYVLDLWFDKVVRKQCKGQAYIVRYADDYVCCFQNKDDAEAFYRALIKRLEKFNLELAEDKTKIIPFGRYAEENCKKNGGTKPPTFDFLGFTHYCSKDQKGKFRVKLKSSSKKMRAKLKECKEWLKASRTTNIHDVKSRLDRSLVGYYNYYCVTDNIKHVSNFKDKVRRLFFKWMNRRSQKKSFNWDKYVLFLKKFPFPVPRTKVSIFELKREINYIL
ncbi:group II intron reverse transcriptase/maturase [Anaerobacillus isosaccharinicus]|uniref:Group II intron reverse transcriptase/maturase n=1 Tax=Anaerobacillus isosaccharinicus TaxID=1532552 RepID=A0A1S2M399_9BACI|nr:group II intron reverse transcriptase/maturase [Anaerobacillus isosaccharinicus]MBA5588245.1 group II intron reverse transcriptase/maturase [Anaerobacillus isosaccharinicus]QOY38311.1 group II intron reverse transcriptase/maturase [Anaerobacillus isosaccharinicus]